MIIINLLLIKHFVLLFIATILILLGLFLEARTAHSEELCTPLEGEWYTAEVSAYSSTPDQTWGNPFIMASGKRVYKGAIACPPNLPFGQQVMLDNRIYTCEDRMNPRYHDRMVFDVWFERRDQATRFGRKNIDIMLIDSDDTLLFNPFVIQWD